MMNRRDFLTTSSLLGLSPTAPMFLARDADAAGPGRDRPALVVIQLDGGNDALNTVVPFRHPDYSKLRPTLALPKRGLIRLNSETGLHPALGPLSGLWEAGQLAVIPGVGYPNPSRSHFAGMAVWHTARLDADGRAGYGWLGRALDGTRGSSCAVSGTVPRALRGRRSRALSITGAEEMLLHNADAAKRSLGAEPPDDLLAFVRRQALDGYGAAARLRDAARARDRVAYPPTGLARQLSLVAKLLKTGLAARVYYAAQSGYDTHSAQGDVHGRLLGEFAGAVAAFFKDLTATRLADRVALMAFSEFGRTIRENASRGTDHGSAGAAFLAGPALKGGVHGTVPSLTELDQGEPVMTTDFRSVYATVLRDWLRAPARGVAKGGGRPALFRKKAALPE